MISIVDRSRQINNIKNIAMKKLIPVLTMFLATQNNVNAQVLETEDSRPLNLGQVEQV